jgi:hypothetical protein
MSSTEKTNQTQRSTVTNDHIADLERSLKMAWTEYMVCVERFGHQAAKPLRIRYFEMYRNFRRIRFWKNLIHNN